MQGNLLLYLHRILTCKHLRRVFKPTDRGLLVPTFILSGVMWTFCRCACKARACYLMHFALSVFAVSNIWGWSCSLTCCPMSWFSSCSFDMACYPVWAADPGTKSTMFVSIRLELCPLSLLPKTFTHSSPLIASLVPQKYVFNHCQLRGFQNEYCVFLWKSNIFPTVKAKFRM